MPSLALIILLLTVALPLLEIAVLIKVGATIGVWPVMAIILATAMIGFYVVRLQGYGVARRLMATMRSGEPPHEPVLEGMLLMFAGACLIAPGLITDCIGLFLLVPVLRQWTARLILTRGFPLAVRLQRRAGPKPGARDRQTRPKGPAPTIEGDYERIDEKPVKPGDRTS